jgi:hypothetical protein
VNENEVTNNENVLIPDKGELKRYLKQLIIIYKFIGILQTIQNNSQQTENNRISLGNFLVTNNLTNESALNFEVILRNLYLYFIY